MAQVEVITGADRRRHWTLEEKQRLLAEAFAPGVYVKAFRRRHDVASGSLYTWRKELERDGKGFARVVAITETASAPPPLTSLPNAAAPSLSLLSAPVEQTASLPSVSAAACELPAIEIEVRGNKVRIPGSMPPALATAVLRALVRR